MLRIGQQFKGEVKDLASDGRGVVTHPSGRTFFVPGVWQGESGEFCITGLKGRIGFAALTTLNEGGRSAQRVPPSCQHQGVTQKDCGGCPWQFMAYDAQLAAKQARVIQAMLRLGCDKTVQPIVPSEKQLGYRNRAQLKSNGQVVGYMAANSNNIVAIEGCPVLSDTNQQTLADLRRVLPNTKWSPSRHHKWVTLDIDETVTAASVSVNARLPFQQANSAQNLQIRRWLKAGLSGLVEGKTVLELFCGSGNLTEVIVESQAACVIAVEAVPAALVQLRARAWPMVETVVCDLFSEEHAEKLRPLAKRAEVLVLDPPRDGVKITAPLLGKKSSIKTIFYISCDLATFSRDLAVFMAHGFKVCEVQPLDMFPHTPHIEIMACLTRK
ncbi:class I SAM-dependent RNA methyltransferase [Teredinibacter purpureus]|uniref:class I SAM-dependent RNA methyltransferase n=1 Tax=Teredinibacter purpureus TaxID=2731756 RepID=UPI0005F82EEF|nr:class I SAM-dependent RNA methyltransferase [Teredinibacter purpureus]